MRIILPLLFFVVLYSYQAFGQIKFSPDPLEVVADANETENIQVDFELTNDSESDYQLAWKLEVVSQPEEWNYYVCDTEICYNFNQNESNTEKPNILQSKSSIVIMFHAIPDRTEGVGEYKISFFDVSKPDEVLIEVPVTVNALTTSTKNMTVKGLAVFPNPATDYFRVNTGDLVDRIDLYTVIGKKITSFKAEQGKFYDISSINPGMYYIRLIDDKDQVIKVMKLKKN